MRFHSFSVAHFIKEVDIFLVHYIKLDEELGMGIISSLTISYFFIARTPESDWNLARANNFGFSLPFAIGAVSN